MGTPKTNEADKNQIVNTIEMASYIHMWGAKRVSGGDGVVNPVSFFLYFSTAPATCSHPGRMGTIITQRHSGRHFRNAHCCSLQQSPCETYISFLPVDVRHHIFTFPFKWVPCTAQWILLIAGSWSERKPEHLFPEFRERKIISGNLSKVKEHSNLQTI